MKISRFLILCSSLAIVSPPLLLADNVPISAGTTNANPADPAANVPSEPRESALEKTLEPSSLPANNDIADTVAQMEENIQVPDYMRTSLIRMEETRLASLQQTMINLHELKRYAEDSQNHKVSDDLDPQEADLDRKMKETSDQIQESRQRLAILQAGPLTEKNYLAYSQMLSSR